MLKTTVIRTLAMAAHYAAALGLLFHSYPWSVHYSNFHFPPGMTLVSYLLVGAISTSVAAGLSPYIVRRILRGNRSRVAQFFTVFGVAALIFAGLSMLFGPGGANVPGTRVRGIFFSEWMFVVFFISVGLPLSALASLLQLFLDREIAEPPC